MGKTRAAPHGAGYIREGGRRKGKTRRCKVVVFVTDFGVLLLLLLVISYIVRIQILHLSFG